jgi:hypothetical protein
VTPMATCSTPRVGWSGALFRSLRPKKILRRFSMKIEDYAAATPYIFFLFFSCRSVAANIDYSLESDLSNFFLQLRIGPTDLFMVVPRNGAIFPKLHTNRY